VLASARVRHTNVCRFAAAARYEWFVDDLPIWGFVGEASEGGGEEAAAVYVYTHRSFDISYNGDNIIQVNLTSESPAALVVGTPLAFTYSVTWHASRTRFAQRFERYLDYNFFEHQIHVRCARVCPRVRARGFTGHPLDSAAR
jgi:transmembrane 9 superfamily protein 3